MKKLSLLFAATCMLFMISCSGNGNTNDQQGDKAKSECCAKEKDGECPKKKGECPMMTEEQKQECKAFAEKWEKFDTLTEAEQKELIAKKKSFMDERRAKMKEMLDECEKKWEGFDALSVKEQKEFLDNMPCDKKCDKKPGDCPKKDEVK